MNDPVAGVRVRSLTLFPLKQVNYTIIFFLKNGQSIGFYTSHINFNIFLQLRSLNSVYSLFNCIIGYVSECMQVTCLDGSFEDRFERMNCVCQ
jgi:hypothetical protein